MLSSFTGFVVFTFDDSLMCFLPLLTRHMQFPAPSLFLEAWWEISFQELQRNNDQLSEGYRSHNMVYKFRDAFKNFEERRIFKNIEATRRLKNIKETRIFKNIQETKIFKNIEVTRRRLKYHLFGSLKGLNTTCLAAQHCELQRDRLHSCLLWSWLRSWLNHHDVVWTLKCDNICEVCWC